MERIVDCILVRNVRTSVKIKYNLLKLNMFYSIHVCGFWYTKIKRHIKKPKKLIRKRGGGDIQKLLIETWTQWWWKTSYWSTPNVLERNIVQIKQGWSHLPETEGFAVEIQGYVINSSNTNRHDNVVKIIYMAVIQKYKLAIITKLYYEYAPQKVT